MRKSAAAALCMLLMVGCVVAPPAPRRAPPPPTPAPGPAAIDQRQRDLEYRIEQGVRSGLITRDEHQLLRRQADDVRANERRYMDDGQLSEPERRSLGNQLEALALEIDRQLRDADRTR